MRKGQGISINVIVIAALALIILVILSTIVIQKVGGFNKNASVCGKTSSAEYCADRAMGCNTAGGETTNPTKPCLAPGSNDPDPTQVCCIRS